MPAPLVTTDAGALATQGRAPDAEASLVERLRRRDPDAVGTVYDAHHRAVRAFARRLTGDDDAAEDLVQDVFVALPGAVRKFKGAASLRTFVIAIAVNHARHYVRAAVRRRRALDRLAREPDSDAALPDEATHRRRLVRALVRALDDLPLKQRLVFVLCDLEQRSSSEVATMLGIPGATVRTRLHHAREALRLRLAQEGAP